VIIAVRMVRVADVSPLSGFSGHPCEPLAWVYVPRNETESGCCWFASHIAIQLFPLPPGSPLFNGGRGGDGAAEPTTSTR
jgi:hypothetical protein